MGSRAIGNEDSVLLESRISEPPTSLREVLGYMGPAWVFTASQIGGGEALSVPLIAAFLGMKGIWLIPVISFTKIFGQYYLVRYGVVSGRTFLEGLLEKRWMRILFYWVMLGGVFYAIGLTGHLAETAGTFNHLLPVSIEFWTVATLLLGVAIVFTKSYGLIEKISTVLLWPFLIMITLVALLVWPGLGDWAVGLRPGLPGYVDTLGGSGWFVIALSFGWIGAGFGPTVSYAWFAKDKHIGMFQLEERVDTSDLSEEEVENVMGWRNLLLWQNVLSSVLLAVFSVMIWVASAQTLHKMGIRPSGFEVVPQMANIFTAVYGEWSSVIFVLSIMSALFSTLIGPLYGMSRLYEDVFGYHGLYERFNVGREWVFRGAVIALSVIPLIFSLLTDNPLFLFSLSGVLFAPIIGCMYLAAIWMSFRDLDRRLRPKRWWALALGIFGALMTILSSVLEIF